MSLATRCVACGTIFRVVQDQLKVSEGWVRCGRCDEVFNALEGLFDLDHEPPPRWPAPSSPSTVHSASPADTADSIVIEPHAVPGPSWMPEAADPRDGRTSLADAPGSHSPAESGPHRHDPYVDGAPPGFGRAPADAGPPVPRHVDADADADRAAFAPTPAEPDHDHAAFAFADADAELQSGPLQDDDRVPASAESATGPPITFVPMPAFVARAERDARWRQPGRLAGLSALVLLLALMLGAQAAHHFRDTLSARWPAARDPLARWCDFVGCRLAAPRRIEDIVVENTGLTRAVAGTDTYRLAVTLRNRGSQPIALPFVDLTLTDNSGQLVARRALAPADFQRASTTGSAAPPTSGAATIAASADLPLQTLIATGSSKVSGYTVEIFYP